jgi:GAF domain-containing protein
MSDEARARALAADVRAVENIRGVDHLLKLICQVTGMGFAVVARVTNDIWMACAVYDVVDLGVRTGQQIPAEATLCRLARESRSPLAIDYASRHPTYREHQMSREYGLESYLSVPIVLADGEYFGNLCAVHAEPLVVSDEKTVALFITLAELIASQLDPQPLRMRTYH